MSEGRSAERDFTDLFVTTRFFKIFKGKTGYSFGKLLTVFPIVLLFVLVVLLSCIAIQQNLARLDVMRIYFHEPAIDPNVISQKAIMIGDERLAGIINYKSGNYTNAQSLLMDTIRQHPGDLTTRYYLGNTVYELGDLENALIEWRLADASRVAQKFVLRAGQADLEGDEPHLVEFARIAIDLDPENGQAYYFLGRWFYKQRAFQEALSSYYRAEALSKENELFAKIYRGIGFVYSDSNDHDLAAKFLEKAIEYMPSDRRYYYYLDLADQYIQLRRCDEAIRQTDFAIQIDEKLPLAYIKKGDAYSILGQKEQALKYYLRSIEVDPDTGRGDYALGKYLYTIGEYGQSIIHLERAVSLRWDYIWVWSEMAAAYSKNGQLEKAAAAYQTIINKSPDKQTKIKALILLAKVYHQLRLVREEERAWKSLLYIDPDNPEAVQGLNGIVQ